MFIPTHYSSDPHYHKSQHFTSHPSSSLIQEVSDYVTLRISGLHNIIGSAGITIPGSVPVDVGTWFSGSTAELGEQLDSMILEIFYIHNISIVLSCAWASLSFWQEDTKQSSSQLAGGSDVLVLSHIYHLGTIPPIIYQQNAPQITVSSGFSICL